MERKNNMMLSIKWGEDDLIILDQTKLPEKTEFITLKTVEEVWDAIKNLR